MVLSETAALARSLWDSRVIVLAAIAAVYLALFLKRALRDGYFDAVPTLNIYIGKGKLTKQQLDGTGHR